MTFQLTKDYEDTVECAIQVLSEMYTVVGWRTVTIGPEIPSAGDTPSDKTKYYDVDLRTDALGVTGGPNLCVGVVHPGQARCSVTTAASKRFCPFLNGALGATERDRRVGGLLSTIGSLSLCRSLLAAELVDRLRVVVFPVVTGATGRERIFDGYPDLALDLVEKRTFDGRLQLLEYVPTVLDGPPGAGEA